VLGIFFDAGVTQKAHQRVGKTKFSSYEKAINFCSIADTLPQFSCSAPSRFEVTKP